MAETVNIRIPKQIKDDLKVFAEKEGVSMGAAIALLLEKVKRKRIKN